jgi:hypothetical protein
LSKVWEIKDVELLDVAAADKTWWKRHRFVFTKLHMFKVDVQKLLFFDLDVVVRRDPSELFAVHAPAGMYHGTWDRMRAEHGKELPEDEAFGSPDAPKGCVNAGLLRIDPMSSETERQTQYAQMVKASSQLSADDQSYLPEQYFLVRRLSGWRHIDVKWNCEVCPRYYVDHKGQVVSVESLVHQDWVLLCDSQLSLQEGVRMFHFSGTWLEPWWFINRSAEDGFEFVRHQLEHRDPAGMVALAVGEWLRGIEQMQLSSVFGIADQKCIAEHVSSLSRTAHWWWSVHQEVCGVCGKLLYFAAVLRQCEECTVRLRLQPAGATSFRRIRARTARTNNSEART